MKTPLPYTQDADVWLRSGPDLVTAWEQLLANCQFMPVLMQAWQQSGKAPAEFSIVIKTDFISATGANTSAVYVDPQLIGWLTASLAQVGFTNVTVGEAADGPEDVFANQLVATLGEQLGYTANSYTLANLRADLVTYDFGGTLGEHRLSRLWRDADFRLSFAKNRTDRTCFYAGTMLNVLSCVAPVDRRPPPHVAEIAGLVLDRFPVQFGFVDAWISGCGRRGDRVADTRTLLAGPNLLAIDWVLGEKMDVDPAQNFVVQEALLRWGAVHIRRRGNLMPWSGWHNVRAGEVLLYDWFNA